MAHKAAYESFVQADAIVLNEGKAYLMVEREHVVVNDLFAGAFQGVRNRPRPPEGIQNALVLEVVQLLDDARGQLPFTALVAGGGKSTLDRGAPWCTRGPHLCALKQKSRLGRSNWWDPAYSRRRCLIPTHTRRFARGRLAPSPRTSDEA